jgi:hypothetical protein
VENGGMGMKGEVEVVSEVVADCGGAGKGGGI